MAASSLLLSPLSSGTSEMSSYNFSSFLPSPKLIVNLKSRKTAFQRFRFKSPVAQKSFDHVPRQFREENLKDGLMDNYKNAPWNLYGLAPSQMDMLMTEDNPFSRQAEKVTEESISSCYNYVNNGGMWSLSGMNERGPSKYSKSVSMSRGGYGRPRSAPPDLPSLLLDSRIVYLGMPMVPAVTELIVAEFYWLDYDDQTKPIYLYINSSGTQNEKMEIVGSETDAYAIADAMTLCNADVYTVNLAMAYGQAAMLLSRGAKRALLPSSSTKIYLPKVHRSSGYVTDMWIKAKELDANKDYYVELLAEGTKKPKEEIEREIQRPKCFMPKQAIEYGIADQILYSLDGTFEKKDYKEMLAQTKARRKEGRVGPQAAPSHQF